MMNGRWATQRKWWGGLSVLVLAMGWGLVGCAGGEGGLGGSVSHAELPTDYTGRGATPQPAAFIGHSDGPPKQRGHSSKYELVAFPHKQADMTLKVYGLREIATGKWALAPKYGYIKLWSDEVAIAKVAGMDQPHERFELDTGVVEPFTNSQMSFATSGIKDTGKTRALGITKTSSSGKCRLTFFDDAAREVLTLENVPGYIDHAEPYTLALTYLDGGAYVVQSWGENATAHYQVFNLDGQAMSPPMPKMTREYGLIDGQVRYMSAFVLEYSPLWPLQLDGTNLPKPQSLIGLKPIYSDVYDQTKWVTGWMVIWDTPASWRWAVYPGFEIDMPRLLATRHEAPYTAWHQMDRQIKRPSLPGGYTAKTLMLATADKQWMAYSFNDGQNLVPLHTSSPQPMKELTAQIAAASDKLIRDGELFYQRQQEEYQAYLDKREAKKRAREEQRRAAMIAHNREIDRLIEAGDIASAEALAWDTSQQAMLRVAQAAPSQVSASLLQVVRRINPDSTFAQQARSLIATKQREANDAFRASQNTGSGSQPQSYISQQSGNDIGERMGEIKQNMIKKSQMDYLTGKQDWHFE